jgi:hypothetical protein
VTRSLYRAGRNLQNALAADVNRLKLYAATNVNPIIRSDKLDGNLADECWAVEHGLKNFLGAQFIVIGWAIVDYDTC